MLLKLRKQVLDGASLSVEDVREACNDHVRKQESGMTSLTMRADNESGLGGIRYAHGIHESAYIANRC